MSIDGLVDACLEKDPKKLNDFPKKEWRNYINSIAKKGDVKKLETILKYRNDALPTAHSGNEGYKKLLKPVGLRYVDGLGPAIKLREITQVQANLPDKFIDDVYFALAKGGDLSILVKTGVIFEESGFGKLKFDKPFDEIYDFYNFIDKKQPTGKIPKVELQKAILICEIFPYIRSLFNYREEKKLPGPFVVGPNGTKLKGYRLLKPSQDYDKMLNILGPDDFYQESVDTVHALMTNFIEDWLGCSSEKLERVIGLYKSLELLSRKSPSLEKTLEFVKSLLRHNTVIKKYISFFPTIDKKKLAHSLYEKKLLGERDVGATKLYKHDFYSIKKATGIEVPLELLLPFRTVYFETGDLRFEDIHELHPALKSREVREKANVYLKDVDADTAYDNLLNHADPVSISSIPAVVEALLDWIKLSNVMPSQKIIDRAYEMLFKNGYEEYKNTAVKMYKKLEILPSRPEIKDYILAQVQPNFLKSRIASLNQNP